MFRKLVLPLAATALLAGCVTTAPYGYRNGQGDYYYGSPSVEYRHHGFYGDPYYGPYRPGFRGSIGYGWPHGYYGRGFYGRGYYGHPYYGHPYYRPIIVRPRPHDGHARPDNRPDGGGWRNFDELRRRRDTGAVPGGVGPSPSAPVAPRMPRMDDGDRGSRMGEMIRRAREGAPPAQDQ